MLLSLTKLIGEYYMSSGIQTAIAILPILAAAILLTGLR